ncbi:MAG: hypothetical protein J0M34_02440 [Alphaproteobacteria bacterium]|nr:hypothetical protein [Alphaproteobacteria bacterium]
MEKPDFEACKLLAIYTYSNGALIDEVEIVTNEQGGARAYLHAREGITPQDITNIQQQFALKGWVGVPMSRNGRPYLELRGFKKEKNLLEFLTQREWVTPTVATAPSASEKPKSAWDKFLAATLKWSGLVWVVGDAAFMTYAGMEQHHYNKELKIANAARDALDGLADSPAAIKKLGEEFKPVADFLKNKPTANLEDIRKSLNVAIKSAADDVNGTKAKIVAGVGYALGSIILSTYGSKDQSQSHIKKSVQKIDRFIQGEGLAGSSRKAVLTQEPENKNKNIFERFHDTLSKYPSEALNVVYLAVGGLLMYASAKRLIAPQKEYEGIVTKMKNGVPILDKLGKPKTYNSFTKRRMDEGVDIMLGTVTASSALAGLVIKEKKPVEGQEKNTGVEGVWDWIQEKPLRATGVGYMIATGFHAYATHSKWRTGDELTRKTIIGRGIFVATNLIAEGLLAISSKGHGEGVDGKDVHESVIAATAEYVAKQDPSTHEVLIERLAGYMSSPSLLSGKAADIALELRTQVNGMIANPWAQIQREKQQTKVDQEVAPIVAAEHTKPTSKVSAVNLDSQRLVAQNAQQL